MFRGLLCCFQKSLNLRLRILSGGWILLLCPRPLSYSFGESKYFCHQFLITMIINHISSIWSCTICFKNGNNQDHYSRNLPLILKPLLIIGPYPTCHSFKGLEKVVARHLQDHLKVQQHFWKFQSGFRSAHSTETALVRVQTTCWWQLMLFHHPSLSFWTFLQRSTPLTTVYFSTGYTILLDLITPFCAGLSHTSQTDLNMVAMGSSSPVHMLLIVGTTRVSSWTYFIYSLHAPPW